MYIYACICTSIDVYIKHMSICLYDSLSVYIHIIRDTYVYILYIYIDYIIYIYIYIHLVCCSTLTFIILCHNVCSLMLFMTKFLTCLTDDFFFICSK